MSRHGELKLDVQSFPGELGVTWPHNVSPNVYSVSADGDEYVPLCGSNSDDVMDGRNMQIWSSFHNGWVNAAISCRRQADGELRIQHRHECVAHYLLPGVGFCRKYVTAPCYELRLAPSSVHHTRLSDFQDGDVIMQELDPSSFNWTKKSPIVTKYQPNYTKHGAWNQQISYSEAVESLSRYYAIPGEAFGLDRDMNKALNQDEKDALQTTWMCRDIACLKTAMELLDNQRKPDELFRVVELPKDWKKHMLALKKVGTFYWPAFTSTTSDRSAAEALCKSRDNSKERHVVFVISTDDADPNFGVRVTDMGLKNHEYVDETLLNCYTKLAYGSEDLSCSPMLVYVKLLHRDDPFHLPW